MSLSLVIVAGACYVDSFCDGVTFAVVESEMEFCKVSNTLLDLGGM